MNKDLFQTSKINKLLYKMLFKELISAEVEVSVDGNVKLLVDGDVKNIKIAYQGSPNFVSLLPEGYNITISSNIIRIMNLMGKPLPLDNIIFKVTSGFNIKSIFVRNWFNKTVKAKITDLKYSDRMNLSNTKFEDSSRIIQTEIALSIAEITKAKPPITTGLYTKQPFANGYTGYYHYFPDKDIYMTGSSPSPDSKLILNKHFKRKTRKALESILLSKNSNRGVTTDISFEKAEEIMKSEVYHNPEKLGTSPRNIKKTSTNIKNIAGKTSSANKNPSSRVRTKGKY